jgi:hypothetical protein
MTCSLALELSHDGVVSIERGFRRQLCISSMVGKS